MPETIHPRLAGIHFGLEAADAFDAIGQLSDPFCDLLPPADAMRVPAAAIARETLGCTCIGSGTALPHARLPNLSAYLVTLGFATAPIRWGADGQEVRLVLLSVFPSSANMAYLEFMSRFMRAFRVEAQAQELMNAANETQARAWLKEHLSLE